MGQFSAEQGVRVSSLAKALGSTCGVRAVVLTQRNTDWH